MARQVDIDELIREALRAEDLSELEQLGEPGLPEMVTAVFRGRMRWFGVMFMAMILVFTVLAAWCGIRFLRAEAVPDMLRWGAGFFVCLVTIVGGKTWYWMQMERVAVTREIKRVELLVAHLATSLRPPSGAE